MKSRRLLAPLAAPARAAVQRSTSMRISVVSPAELGPAELARWRQLQYETPGLDNPFLAPEFTLAVARARRNVGCAVLEDTSTVVGFFAFERHRGGIGRAVGAGLSDCQGIVLAPGVEVDALWLLRHCGLAAWEFDRLLEQQPAFAAYHRTRWRSLAVDLTGGYDAYLRDRRQATRKLLTDTSRKERRLERDSGPLRFEYHAPARELYQLMAWKSKQYRRSGLADQFARADVMQLVEELVTIQTADFAGVLPVLYADEQPIAGNIMLRSRTVLSGWFPAYDAAFARYSPGMVHRFRTLEAAAAAGIERVELGREGQEHKARLSNSESVVVEGAVERLTPVTVVRRISREPTRALRSFVIHHPSLYSTARRGLRIVGRIRASTAREA